MGAGPCPVGVLRNDFLFGQSFVVSVNENIEVDVARELQHLKNYHNKWVNPYSRDFSDQIKAIVEKVDLLEIELKSALEKPAGMVLLIQLNINYRLTGAKN